MTQFNPVLNSDEITQLRTIAERIQTSRPTERGKQMLVHHAVEDAVSGLICIGQGNPSCAQDFAQLGKNIRDIVIKGI